MGGYFLGTVCVHVYVCIHMCMYMLAYTHTHTYIHTYRFCLVKVHVHTYMHTCIHAYRYLTNPENFFVFSSDFCHWGERFGYQYYDPSHGQIFQVCMYIYMYACMYNVSLICGYGESDLVINTMTPRMDRFSRYASTYVCMYVCDACISIMSYLLYVYMCIKALYVCMYTCILIMSYLLYVCMYVCVYVCMYVCDACISIMSYLLYVYMCY
jgi:hypothetical protein